MGQSIKPVCSPSQLSCLKEVRKYYLTDALPELNITVEADRCFAKGPIKTKSLCPKK
jgi:hypothetical protein